MSAAAMCRNPQASRYSLPASLDAVRSATASSEFLQSIRAAKDTFGEARWRPLTVDECNELERNGTHAEDWDRVKVADQFMASTVRNCGLYGDVRLGVFADKIQLASKTTILPSGVYNSDLCNVVVEDNALVSRTSLVSNVVVGQRACIFGCGEVTCHGKTSFGNGIELPLAIETGGRETRTYAEITVAVAAGVASNRHMREELAEYDRLVDAYVEEATSDIMVIEHDAHVLNTPKLINVYVGPHAVIDSATWIENVTMLSCQGEASAVKAGSVVKRSIIQWGSDVDTMGMVHNSVMCEHSHVERHGMLTDSILGPNSGVAEGEVTASLCGPFVGFHHQSLLIASFWPDGKGNVGYGANVGSNHTSKAPDQELWPGEGTFFGLGSCIKFPADFTRAPYSIIASGVTTLPQRMAIPFALINSPSESLPGISPAYNEIFPGWVLSDNIYTVKRNEGKYQKRNKARRSEFDFAVFRPPIVDEMMRTRKLLQDVAGRTRWTDSNDQPVYTDYEIRELGKNFVRESARLNGIIAYTFYIHNYALTGLWEQLQAGADPATVLSAAASDATWAHQLSIINQELAGMSLCDLLNKLISSQDKICAEVRISKEKDDVRGIRIIEDYAYAHTSAAKDSFVVETERTTAQVTAALREYIQTKL